LVICEKSRLAAEWLTAEVTNKARTSKDTFPMEGVFAFEGKWEAIAELAGPQS
jgi:hypothetical protein